MPATKINLTNALVSSINAWVPNIRFRPDRGLSLLGLKPMALVENNQPPIRAGVINARTKVSNRNGMTAKMPSTKVANKILGNLAVSIKTGLSMVSEEISICEILSIMVPPVISKKAAPNTMIMAIDSSFERGTWPSSRDFSSFLAVGCSVFSWELSSDTVKPHPVTCGSAERLQTTDFGYCP